jgi:hypothetical protein
MKVQQRMRKLLEGNTERQKYLNANREYRCPQGLEIERFRKPWDVCCVKDCWQYTSSRRKESHLEDRYCYQHMLEAKKIQPPPG